MLRTHLLSVSPAQECAGYKAMLEHVPLVLIFYPHP